MMTFGTSCRETQLCSGTLVMGGATEHVSIGSRIRLKDERRDQPHLPLSSLLSPILQPLAVKTGTDNRPARQENKLHLPPLQKQNHSSQVLLHLTT